jgi:hypothetical protein
MLSIELRAAQLTRLATGNTNFPEPFMLGLTLGISLINVCVHF